MHAPQLVLEEKRLPQRGNGRRLMIGTPVLSDRMEHSVTTVARGLVMGRRFSPRLRMANICAAHADGFPGSSDRRYPGQRPNFHTLFDLDDLCHIPGAAHLRGGYRVPDYPQGPDEGKGADWRAIYDDNASRLPPLTISIFGDSWE
jgi:hypothetical protein